MIIFKKAIALNQYITSLKQQNKTIGFVPTMGALHPGHLSLIEASKEQCDISVCSIFVNPTQFNDPKDFEKYPVTIDQDVLLLTQHYTDILFLPSVYEIYPNGTNNLPYYDLGELENILEGKYRPSHFQGVCKVVHRLLKIVQPEKLFIGRKDYQQCMVISKLIELKQLPVNIFIQPTMRENSGLAMSSRNTRLSEEGSKKAVALYDTLVYIKEHFHSKGISSLIEEANKRLLAANFEKVDYISIADAKTLQPLSNMNSSTTAIVLAAAFIEGVRLIDNMLITT